MALVEFSRGRFMVVAYRTQFLTRDTLGHLQNRETQAFCSNYATLLAKFDFFFYIIKKMNLFTRSQFYNYKILKLLSISLHR